MRLALAVAGGVTAWVMLLAGCGGHPNDAGDPVAEGREKTRVTERKGIITIGPHLTEVVFALGQGEQIIAVDAFSDYPADAAALPKVGGYFDADLERITMLRPALLIVAGAPEKVIEYGRLHTMPVLDVHMDSLATIDAGIGQVGEALGCTESAEALRAEIQAGIAAVREAVAGRPRPRVLIITGRSQHALNPLFTVGGTSFVSEVVAVAGGDNIYHEATQAYFEASKEEVVMKAPEVILEFHAGEELSGKQQSQYIADWRRLPSLPAVSAGRVHVIVESHSLRPGPRVIGLAWQFAKLMHPGV